MAKEKISTQADCMQPSAGERLARNLDWNLLRIFHEIVCAGGISKAAKLHSRKQPATSMALRRLEELMGTVLCQRGPSGFYLTQEGEMLAETCRGIFDSIANVPSTIANSISEIRGRVRIQMISNLVDRSLDNQMRIFHQSYPAVEIFINISAWEVVPQAVLRNVADIGISPAQVRKKTLKYEPFFREKYQIYCGSQHALYGHTFRDPSRLSAYGLIHTGADEPEQLATYRLKYRIGRNVAGMAERMEEALRLTLLSTGICFIPKALAQPDAAAGRLHPLLETDDLPSSQIFLIWNPDAQVHRARDRMLELFRSENVRDDVQ